VLVPFNVLLIGLDNLVFLLCPTRPPDAARPFGQLSPRKVLLNLGKGLVQIVALFMSAGLGIAIYFLTDRRWGWSIAVAGVMLAAFAAGVIPLMALAFQRFDVVRDRPA
jgi:hypothetical protein